MPSYFTPKQERQYTEIVKSCMRTKKGKGALDEAGCKRVAAATVNKARADAKKKRMRTSSCGCGG
jgi:hypothetical protein